MTLRQALEELIDGESPVLFMDGFDDAIIGYCDKDMRVIYSESKIIDQLMREGMEDIDAIEYYSYNIDCAYVGKHTPIICKDLFAYE